MIKILHPCSSNPKGIILMKCFTKLREIWKIYLFFFFFLFGKCPVAGDLECDFPSYFTIDL